METAWKQRFSQMEGLPGRDDEELAVLMEVVRGLPGEGAEEAILNLLRASLGYERTGNADYLTALARTALLTIRVRRDPEDQAALDARPGPVDPDDRGIDMETMLARYGITAAEAPAP